MQLHHELVFLRLSEPGAEAVAIKMLHEPMLPHATLSVGAAHTAHCRTTLPVQRLTECLDWL